MLSTRTTRHLFAALAVTASTVSLLSCESGTSGPPDYSASFADTVVDAPGADNEPYGDPQSAVDGVHGGGEGAANAADVFSIGLEDSLVLSWEGQRVMNGDGIDFVIFENGFRIGTGDEFFGRRNGQRKIVAKIARVCHSKAGRPVFHGGMSGKPKAQIVIPVPIGLIVDRFQTGC